MGGGSLGVEGVVHADAVGESADLDEVVLGHAQHVGAGERGERARVLAEPVGAHPLRERDRRGVLRERRRRRQPARVVHVVALDELVLRRLRRQDLLVHILEVRVGRGDAVDADRAGHVRVAREKPVKFGRMNRRTVHQRRTGRTRTENTKNTHENQRAASVD